MQLNSIKIRKGATHSKKRVGRGNASGHGTFCGRGCKGQGQRKSGNVRPGFEGGQTPLIMRLPKLRGFTSHTKVPFQTVNIKNLNCFKDDEEVNILSLFERKLIRRKNQPVKILGDGKLEHKLTVKVHKLSAEAKKKILAAGGKII